MIADGHRFGSVDGRDGPPHQAVIKVCGKAKSRATAVKMLDYVARTREKDRRAGVSVDLYDEGGLLLQRRAGRDELENWIRFSEAENLTAQSRALGPAAAALREKDRLHFNQVAHLTWSVPAAATESEREWDIAALKEATLGALDEIFAERGRRALWAVHDGHGGGNPHVHILFGLLGRRSGRLERLRLDPDFIDRFRITAARYGRLAGLNVVAERREDRVEMRARILAGEEPLRKNRKTVQYYRETDLARRVPIWFVAQSTAMAGRRRRLREKRRRRPGEPLGRILPPAKKARRKSVPSDLSDVGDVLEAVYDSYRDPTAAIRSWKMMATEGATRSSAGWTYPNKSLADWYMRRQPIVFGDITAAALAHRRSPGLFITLGEACPLPGPTSVVLPAKDHKNKKAGREEAAAIVKARLAELARVRRVIAADFGRMAVQTKDRLGAVGRADKILRAAAAVADRRLP
jgi:hypothetical protein